MKNKKIPIPTPRLFKPKKDRDHSQDVTININITEEKDDGVADCIGSCFSACFGIAKKAATS